MNSKVALITGVSKNIGKSICRKFSKNGYKIVGTYCPDTISNAEDLKNEIPNITLYQVDFCDENQTTSFIEDAKVFKFDVIVNNAGMLNLIDGKIIRNEFDAFDLQSFKDVMNCNFYAPLRICLELKKNINNGGHIVNIASGAGLKATYATLSYSTSKAALINLTASLSNSFFPLKNVRVNSVSPGWIMPDEDGGMNVNEDSPGGKAKYLTPLLRNGKTEEVANVVFLLTQDETSFINGANIVVDGGYSNHDVIYYEEATGKNILHFSI